MEPVSDVVIEVDCTGSRVIEVFDDLDKVSNEVALLLGCPQSCMPSPVESLLEVYEDMEEVFLVQGVFLTKDS